MTAKLEKVAGLDLDALAAKADQDFTLRITCERLAELHQERDRLIREHKGTLREIAQAAGLSHTAVANIKAKEEK